MLSANVSAQSPPCSRNALPSATRASRLAQLVDLVGRDDGRHRREHALHLVDRGLVRPRRGLRAGQGAPMVQPKRIDSLPAGANSANPALDAEGGATPDACFQGTGAS